MSDTRRPRDLLGRVAVAIWAPCMLVVVSLLMVNHVIAMPGPTDLSRLETALSEHAGPSRTLVHVIYQHCSCTRGLVRHLLERGPYPDANEVVLFVGADRELGEQMRAAGYSFQTLSRDHLVQKYGLEAAPILSILDAGELRYVGGYYRLPAAIHPLDQALVTALDHSEKLEPLPVFGCAVSERLLDQVDPLGLQGRY